VDGPEKFINMMEQQIEETRSDKKNIPVVAGFIELMPGLIIYREVVKHPVAGFYYLD